MLQISIICTRASMSNISTVELESNEYKDLNKKIYFRQVLKTKTIETRAKSITERFYHAQYKGFRYFEICNTASLVRVRQV